MQLQYYLSSIRQWNTYSYIKYVFLNIVHNKFVDMYVLIIFTSLLYYNYFIVVVVFDIVHPFLPPEIFQQPNTLLTNSFELRTGETKAYVRIILTNKYGSTIQKTTHEFCATYKRQKTVASAYRSCSFQVVTVRLGLALLDFICILLHLKLMRLYQTGNRFNSAFFLLQLYLMQQRLLPYYHHTPLQYISITL